MSYFCYKILVLIAVFTSLSNGQSFGYFNPNPRYPNNNYFNYLNDFGYNFYSQNNFHLPNRNNNKRQFEFFESVTQQPVTTPVPTPVQRPRQFYICFSACGTLSQYNPVCGDDNTTYHNADKLACANRCGAFPRVNIRRDGVCPRIG
uniref:Putative kazal type serine protease inhibitor n=1 Tax=Corethrella appendiculata TaxID=1370023 RepID=U5ENN6_9DIPT